MKNSKSWPIGLVATYTDNMVSRVIKRNIAKKGFAAAWIEWDEEWTAYFNSPMNIRNDVIKKYIDIGGPTDAELKKIEKENKNIYTIPLEELFKVDDVEIQDTACDSAEDYNAANRTGRAYY